jgi:hypothetical protein
MHQQIAPTALMLLPAMHVSSLAALHAYTIVKCNEISSNFFSLSVARVLGAEQLLLKRLIIMISDKYSLLYGVAQHGIPLGLGFSQLRQC